MQVLNVEQSTVSRLLQETKGKLWTESIELIQENVDSLSVGIRQRANELADARDLDPEILSAAAGAKEPRLKTVRVLSSRLDGPDMEAAKRLEGFCDDAAPHVMRHFATGDLWGVTWGRHLDLLSNALAAPKVLRSKRSVPITFVPLCGEPYGVRPTSQSSSVIAERLTTILNEQSSVPLSLSMIPAFIPGTLIDETERNAVWMLIGCSPSYVQIFGPERLPAKARARLRKRIKTGKWLPDNKPMAERLDGVLTAISQDHRPFGLGAQHMYSTAGLDGQLISKLYLGDIGGVAIAKNSGKEHDAIQARWTGLTHQQLLDCATRAADDAERPGVVAICMGANREKTLLECIRLGMVNHLIIDSDLADRLAQKLTRGRETGRRRVS